MNKLEISSYDKFSLPSGKILDIGKCNLVLKPWSGSPIRDTYNNKAVIDFEGIPLFAEIAVLRILEQDGWTGIWVDSYRGKYRIDLPEKKEPIKIPQKREQFLESIREKTGKRGGCWDIFAWRGEECKFVELKRKGKDAIRDSQIVWLDKSLETGIKPGDFLIVEWDLKK